MASPEEQTAFMSRHMRALEDLIKASGKSRVTLWFPRDWRHADSRPRPAVAANLSVT
jgi:hypothetical protein